MFPRIFRRTGKPGLPFALVQVAERRARRHLEAIVEQTHHAIGRRFTVVVKPDPADQGLVAERDKFRSLVDRLVGVGENEISLLGKFNQPADDAAGAMSSRYLCTSVRASGVATAMSADFAGTTALAG